MTSFLSSLLRPPQSTPQASPQSPTSSTTTTSNSIPEIRVADPMVMWERLFYDGYCILPGAVSKREVDNALRAINQSMGKHVPNRQDMCPDCPNTPPITDLFNKSSLKGVLNTLLGDYEPVGGGQIALRFPGDNTSENFQIPPNWESHWHIDGLGDYRDKQKSALFGDINNFTALVGVVLQDAEEDYMGNLTVYPGSHFQLQNYFRCYGFDDLYQKGVEGLPQLDFNYTQPIQIHARAGDAIILNYSTAHNIAPNISPYIRYTVYFRITTTNGMIQRRGGVMTSPTTTSRTSSMQGPSAMRHRPQAMLSVWSDWRGLQRMSFYSSEIESQQDGLIALGRHETTMTSSGNQQKKENQRKNKTNTTNANVTMEEEEEMRQLALAIERSKHET